MKTSFLKPALLLVMLAAFSGCSSDSDSSTYTPEVCPPGYTGANCSTEITPSKIKISKIKIKQFVDSSWDTFNGPDIYIKLYKSNILIFTSSTYAPNAIGNGTTSYEEAFIPNFESTSISTIFKMELFDYDGDDTPSNQDDLMNTLYFSPYVETQGLGFPSSFNIQDSSGLYKAEVFVNYEW